MLTQPDTASRTSPRTLSPLSPGEWLAVGIAALLATLRPQYCMDDAFISARFARSLLERGEWAFNPGEPVGAATSPLFVLLLLPFERFGLVGVPLFVVLTAAGAAAAGVAASRLYRPLGSRTELWIGLSVATIPIFWDAVGLESPVLIALTLWSAVAHARQRYLLRGTLLGLACVARPDAALLAPILLVLDARARRVALQPSRMPPAVRAVSAGWLLTAAVVSAWLLFAASKIGSVLPSTLSAKLAQTNVGWWQKQPTFALYVFRALPHAYFTLPVTIVVAAWAAARAARPTSVPPLVGSHAEAAESSTQALSAEPSHSAPAEQALYIPVWFGLGQFTAYSLLRVPSGYVWYYAPLAVALLASVAMASSWALSQRWPHPWLRARPLVSAAPLVIVAIQAYATLKLPSDYRFSREYESAAQWFHSRTQPCHVAITEIGYFGYFSRCSLLDIHALIHPAATNAVRARDSLWWYSRKPEWIVTHDPPWHGEPNFTSDGSAATAFLADYREAVRFGQPSAQLVVWGSRASMLGVPPRSAGSDVRTVTEQPRR